MLKIFIWTTTALCLIGTVLNVKKRRECFYLWIIGNIAWLTFDIWSGIYSRAVLDLVQLGFAGWGAVEWGRNDHRR